MNSLSLFITTQMLLPIHLSINSKGKIVDAIAYDVLLLVDDVLFTEFYELR